MNNLEFSHFVRPIKIVNEKITFHFFDVFNLSINEEFYNLLINNKSIFQTESIKTIKTKEYRVADHIPYLDKNYKPLNHPFVSNRIRISMGVLVNIIYQGNSLLLIEKKVIKPFGGGYEFYELPNINSIILDNPKSKDLRFTINTTDLPLIESWFHKNIGRENTPIRELEEELSMENKILTNTEWQKFSKNF